MDSSDKVENVGLPRHIRDALGQAWRAHWSRLIARLTSQFRRMDLAEDALAEAFATAARSWPRDGIPSSSAAWLLTVARRVAMDTLRVEAVAMRKQPVMAVETQLQLAAAAEIDEGAYFPDERLRLLFTCCHPALAPDIRAALTLRFVAGIAVRDIARLFLVKESTMAARLTRAKKKIAASGISFRVPPKHQIGERTETVSNVIYLIFTAGYAAGSGLALMREDIASEAIRLAQLLKELLPQQAVVHALLALMMLQHSRRDARLDADGFPILLPDQDRGRWHHDEIAAALRQLQRVPADATGLTREYLLQALIAGEHATANRAADTNWERVCELYATLEFITNSPVVRLGRAVAVAECSGSAAGLALLDGLDERLPHHHRLPAVRAELLAKEQRWLEAERNFCRAIDLCTNQSELRLLHRRRQGIQERLITITQTPDARW